MSFSEGFTPEKEEKRPIEDVQSALFNKLAAHDAQIQEYQDAIDEYKKLQDSEKEGKADTLEETHIAEFVNNRLTEEGFEVPREGYNVWDDAMLTLTGMYPVGTDEGKEENEPILKQFQDELAAIGIPKQNIHDYIELNYPEDSEGNEITDEDKIQYKGISVTVDSSLIEALVQNAVEKRMGDVFTAHREAKEIYEKEIIPRVRKTNEAMGDTDPELLDAEPNPFANAEKELHRRAEPIRRQLMKELLFGKEKAKDEPQKEL